MHSRWILCAVRCFRHLWNRHQTTQNISRHYYPLPALGKFPHDCLQLMPFSTPWVITILTCVITDWVCPFFNFISHVIVCLALSLTMLSVRTICVVCIQGARFPWCRMTHSASILPLF